MKKTKRYHYVITLRIQCGEYQFYDDSVLTLTTQKTGGKLTQLVDFHAEKRAKTFYDELAWEDDRDFYFNGGEVATRVYAVKPITKDEAKVLKKFL